MSRFEPSPEGVELRALRIDLDLTQIWFAERVGCSDALVALIETGLWRPNARYIRAVAEAFTLTLAWEERVLSLRAIPWEQPVKRRGRGRTLSDVESEPLVLHPLFSESEA